MFNTEIVTATFWGGWQEEAPESIAIVVEASAQKTEGQYLLELIRYLLNLESIKRRFRVN
jgi:hypothetical protein